MSKRNLKNEKLKGVVETTQHFVGKVVREGNYEVNGVKKVLVSPLYMMEEDGHYVYVDHVWMILPDEYRTKFGFTIDFTAKVYSYKKESGDKSYGLTFVDMNNIELNLQYKGLKLDYSEYDIDADRKERRYVNGNLSIIAAFENGDDLRVKRHGKSEMKRFVGKMKHFQACGKHGWSY